MLPSPLFFNFYPHHFVHNQGNHIEDISSYFLFEATGDSEGADSSVDLQSSSPASTEFNDAESCTDDTDRIMLCNNENEDDEDEEGMGVENDDDDDGGEEEEVVESKAIGFSIKSNASIDSTKDEFKMLNEVDKNRLFWETCLAS